MINKVFSLLRKKLFTLNALRLFVLFTVTPILLFGIALSIARYGFGLDSYTDTEGVFHNGKTLWDWMELLIVPSVLAIAVYALNSSENKTERKIAADRMNENAMQAFFAKVIDILERYQLEGKPIPAEAATTIRLLTLSTLRNLDGDRKGMVVRFLYEANLIGSNKFFGGEEIIISPLVCISGADLKGAKLNEINMYHADFSGTDMQNAIFSESILVWVNFSDCKLDNARFNKTSIAFSSFRGASLRNTEFCDATLHGNKYYMGGQPTLNDTEFGEVLVISPADLNNAVYKNSTLKREKVLPQQLKKAKSLKGSTMPDGIRFNGYHHVFLEGVESKYFHLDSRLKAVRLVCTCGKVLFEGNHPIIEEHNAPGGFAYNELLSNHYYPHLKEQEKSIINRIKHRLAVRLHGVFESRLPVDIDYLTIRE